ncbi:MAG: CpaF family protein [Lachnospiraceae bacterium]|nr:CpaF family protein [Lachnospiraceae bacterium]
MSLRERLRLQILNKMDLTREIEDGEIRQMIREEIILLSREHSLTLEERLNLEQEVFNSLRKLDVLQDLLDAEEISEIMINGAENIYVEKNGVIEKSKLKFSSEDKLYDVIQQIVSVNNRMVNESSPIVDTKLPDGSRVNVILSPISLEHSTVTIRKFPKDKITMKKLITLSSLSEEMADFFERLVKAGYNIFISGGTSSGKTTFLNALTEYIPKNERVVTIEDSAELQVQGIDNLVRLESRNATLEGKLEVKIRDLVRAALRIRPDRIIVGECRGAEALDMLQAMNTGHDGSLSTGHGNSCRDMIARLETMVMMADDISLPISAIDKQIASGLDIFVHLGKVNKNQRKVLEVCEVMGYGDGEILLQPLYQYECREGKDVWKRVGTLRHTEKLEIFFTETSTAMDLGQKIG